MQEFYTLPPNELLDLPAEIRISHSFSSLSNQN